MAVDQSKSKAQLIEEIEQLQKRIAELETTPSKPSRLEQDDMGKIIIDTSPAFFVVIDSKGATKMINNAMLEALGYSEEEVLGKNYLTTFIPERDREFLAKTFENELLKGKSTRNQNHVVTKDGRELFVDWQGRPVISHKGGVKLFCGVGLDITEQQKAENELIRISESENKRRQELEKLREISANMRKAEGSSELLQVVTKEVQEFCQADVVSSILYKRSQAPITFLAPEANFKLSQEQSKAITNALIDTQKGKMTAKKIPGFETTFILPLQSSDTVHGALMVASREPDALSADEKNMLNPIADMTGTALNRIDIWETLEERVTQRTHDLVVLYNLITIISENWKLQDLLELSLVLTLETIKADRGIIYLLDDEKDTDLKPVIQRGFADGYHIIVDSLPNNELAREVLKQQKALSLNALAEKTDSENCKDLNSCVAIPIKARGVIRGVFSLFAYEEDIFGSEEMALLASIADHLGIGIENSILYEQARESAALEERNRLARDLHDSVSQLLYSLTLMTGTTKKMLERGSDLEAVKHSVGRLGETAHRALQEMRLLLFELRPAVLDSEGLIGALQHRIKSVEEGLGVKVSLQTDGLPELPSDVEDALYHIALEALNNIVKHAESKAAKIQLTGTDERITMEISDNGKGFDIEVLQRGLGLRNMRERGQMLGSEVIVQSKPGEGTRVSVEVKLPSSSSISSR